MSTDDNIGLTTEVEVRPINGGWYEAVPSTGAPAEAVSEPSERVGDLSSIGVEPAVDPALAASSTGTGQSSKGSLIDCWKGYVSSYIDLMTSLTSVVIDHWADHLGQDDNGSKPAQVLREATQVPGSTTVPSAYIFRTLTLHSPVPAGGSIPTTAGFETTVGQPVITTGISFHPPTLAPGAHQVEIRVDRAGVPRTPLILRANITDGNSEFDDAICDTVRILTPIVYVDP